MNKLAEFLGAKEPLFERSLEQLEERTGKTGVDAALIAEIAGKAADRMKRLGLAADAPGPAIYEALLHKVEQDNERVAKLIGGRDHTSVPEMVPLIVEKIRHMGLAMGGYFLKEDVARAMIVKHPPEQIMARLGYKDAGEMVERESIKEIYVALRFAQDPDWLNAFDEDYHTLTTADFEERDIEIVIFDPAKWGDIAEHFIAKKRHNITHSKELGVIGVMPMTATHMRGLTLKDLPQILHYYNEIRLYSAFFKLMKPKKDFGQIVATTLVADPAHVTIMSSQRIHWRVIQRYYGKLPKEHHPEQFEPHVQPEDLHWRKTEEILYDIDPELEFWQDLDYVAVLRAAGPVTLSLMDVSYSYSNEIAYPERYFYHFRESLWNEIFARYFGQKVLEDQLLNRLDNELIKPETLP